MGMSRARKQEEVQKFHDRLGGAGLVVVTHNLGLTVKEVTDLRNRLRKEGASFKVVKNTLAKRALEGTAYTKLAGMLAGPVGIATSADPVAAAKITQGFAKDHPKFVIVGGAMGENILDAKSVEALSKLPSLDELRSKLLGLFQAPATKLAGLLQAPARDLVGVTKAYGEKA